jgi:hypothetical protein
VFIESNQPETVFTSILPRVCESLKTDRCFLHVRNPHTRMHRDFCWRRDPQRPDTSTNGWEPETDWEKEDPMFAAALRTAPSIFVEDVETAGPDVLNLEFERKYMGHRALVHAHICQDGLLWGILQPCVFGTPRVWSEADRTLIAKVIEQLRPIVIRYVQSAEVKR